MGQVALLETFAVTVPGQPEGTVFRGELWATARQGGRRIRVVAAGGSILFDSDDCYDLGNACNGLDLWLQAQADGAKRLAETMAGQAHREILRTDEYNRRQADRVDHQADTGGGPVG